MTWCLLLASLVWASPSERPYYETRKLTLTVDSRMSPRDYQVAIYEEMKAKKVKKLVVQHAGAAAKEIPISRKIATQKYKLKQPVVIATLLVLIHETRGAELDVIIQTDKGMIPTQVRWDDDIHCISIQVGESFTGPTVIEHDKKALVSKYAIGPLVESGRQWNPAALTILVRALKRLTPQELGFLNGLPFHRMESPSSLTLSRMTRPPGNFGGLQAAYVENSVGPHIEFYDEALKSSTHFSGDPSAPSLMSEWTLLHEIGHAIAAAPRRDLEQIFNRKKERYESLRSQYNELVDEGKTLARTPTRATDKRIEAIQQTLTAFGQELEGLEAELNRLAALAEVIQQPLHQSFIAEIQDLELAPTLYARTSIDEAFAECFAMFRIDPAALQRTNPGIYSWFNTGKHIEGIRASVTLVSSDD